MFIFLFPILSVICAKLWFSFFGSLLEQASISHIPIEKPFLEYSLFGLVFLIGLFVLDLSIRAVEWYRLDTISKRAKFLSQLASFLCFNLALLLRSILIFRLEIEPDMANLQYYFYDMNKTEFLWWGFAGAISGTIISCFILVALSLIRKEKE